MRRIAVMGALVVSLAGCGGEAATTPPTHKAATADDRVARADAACHRAEIAVVKRGWPSRLEDLRNNAEGTVEDVREEIAAIRRLPAPKDEPSRQFLADLDRLDPTLDDVVRAGNQMDEDALARAANELQRRVSALVGSAGKAGLKTCLKDNPHAVVDAIRGQATAAQWMRIGGRLAKDVEASGKGPPETRLRRHYEAIAAHESALAAITPPRWAAKTWRAYRAASRDLVDGLEQITESAESGVVPSSAEIDRLTKGPTERVGRLGVRLADEFDGPAG